MSEPRRWVDAADDEKLRRLLEAARDSGPSPAERAELATRLGVSSSAAVLTPALKSLLLGSAIAVGIAGYHLGASDPASVDPAQAQSPPQASTLEAPETELAPSPVVHSPAAQEPPSKETADLEPRPAGKTSPERAKPESNPSAAKKPSEAQLLSRARALIEKNPKAALGLIKQHEALYPQGILSQERELLRVRSLKASGQTEAARQQASKFREKHPSSVHHLATED